MSHNVRTRKCASISEAEQTSNLVKKIWSAVNDKHYKKLKVQGRNVNPYACDQVYSQIRNDMERSYLVHRW